MRARTPNSVERKNKKWIVFCIGEEADQQRAYIEKLNISTDYNIDIEFHPPIKIELESEFIRGGDILKKIKSA